MASVYSVSQVNAYIKNMFTQDFALNNIYIKGEVSNCKYHTSGHIYFSLKDEKGVLLAVMFMQDRSGLTFRMTDGQTVVALGRVNVYEIAGKYQLYAKEILLDGAGDLHQRFEKLKKDLEEMGMFAPEYKKTIPKYALKIGIVTARTGAAIQDMVNISARRNPYVQLYLYNVKVQGEDAAASIVQGIRSLDNFGVDVIIAGRGGGSIEDLWAFNEESVARAIFECETPIISAVGHETDTTIADYTADLRAPTPSAAAELAVFDLCLFGQALNDLSYTFYQKINQKILKYRNQTQYIRMQLELKNPNHQIQVKKQQSNDYMVRLQELIFRKTLRERHRLELFSERLTGLSPLKKLSGGYAFVSNSGGSPVTSVKQVEEGEELTVRLKDGRLTTGILEIQKEELGNGREETDA